MKPYQIIILVAALIIFVFLAVFFYAFSHVLDFHRALKKKERTLCLIQSETAVILTKLDALFKSEGVTYSEADAKAVDLQGLDFVKPTFGSLMANQSQLNGCKSVLSYLALDNKWAVKGKEYEFCSSAIEDLNRFYRQTVALYNADVSGYNYWRSLPLYRAFFHLFGFKTRPSIP